LHSFHAHERKSNEAAMLLLVLDLILIIGVGAAGIGALCFPLLFGNVPGVEYMAIIGLVYLPYLAITRLAKLAHIKQGLDLRQKATLFGWLVGVIGAFLGFSATEFYHFGLKDMANNGAEIHDALISMYFSVVTLTTVGYGDFVPLDKFGRLAAAWEALIGYVLMAVLVAALVSAFKPERA
jgi:voltage-gated potassium channel Kch